MTQYLPPLREYLRFGGGRTEKKSLEYYLQEQDLHRRKLKQIEDLEVPGNGDHPVAKEKVDVVKVVGRETSLSQKLITVRAVTAIKEGPSESAKAQYVTPFNIFNY